MREHPPEATARDAATTWAAQSRSDCTLVSNLFARGRSRSLLESFSEITPRGENSLAGLDVIGRGQRAGGACFDGE